MKRTIVKYLFIGFISLSVFACNNSISEKNTNSKEKIDYSGLTEEEIKIEKSIQKIEGAMNDLDKAMEKIKEDK